MLAATIKTTVKFPFKKFDFIFLSFGIAIESEFKNLMVFWGGFDIAKVVYVQNGGKKLVAWHEKRTAKFIFQKVIIFSENGVGKWLTLISNCEYFPALGILL